MNSNNGDKSGYPVIGLTGGIGTGKTTAAEYLASKGMLHIDADAISRAITAKEEGVPNPILEEIGGVFGSAGPFGTAGTEVIRPDGSLDRAAMAGLVFSDPEKKKVLEEILFTGIIKRIRQQIDEADRPVLLDAPLLYESGLDGICDDVILITADPEVRIARVTARDGCSPEDVMARMRNQMPEEEKKKRADYIADNSSDLEHLRERLDAIAEELAVKFHIDKNDVCV